MLETLRSAAVMAGAYGRRAEAMRMCVLNL